MYLMVKIYYFNTLEMLVGELPVLICEDGKIVGVQKIFNYFRKKASHVLKI